MAGPDLRRAQARVEELMDDTCKVVADPGGVRDDDLDEATGELVPETGPVTVYDGRCLVTPVTDQDGTPSPDPTTGAVPPGPRYRLLLPLSAAPVARGQVVTVTASVRDPELPSASFVIDAAGQVSTYAVARVVGMQRL